MAHEPLTPPDCDLRDFPFMPLDVQRLRDSDLAATPEPEAFRAAVLAWSVSWHQVPAGSLPDNDPVLCRLLGYGRDMKTWLATRSAGALHGFVLCSDGRLYHPTVCEKANDAWRRKLIQRERSRKGNGKRWGEQRTAAIDPTPNDDGSSAASLCGPSSIAESSMKDHETILKGSREESSEDRKGEGQGQGQRKIQPPSESDAAGAAPKAKDVVLPDWLPADAWATLCRYRRGKKWTVDAQLLSIRELGKLREAGNDPTGVIEQTIRNSWSGLFPLKNGQASSGWGAPRQTQRDAAAAIGRQMREELRNEIDMEGQE
nr:hypothetical protein [uncultured Roseococcus sp.]